MTQVLSNPVKEMEDPEKEMTDPEKEITDPEKSEIAPLKASEIMPEDPEVDEAEPEVGVEIEVASANALPDEFDFEYAKDLQDNYPDIWGLYNVSSAKSAFEFWKDIKSGTLGSFSRACLPGFLAERDRMATVCSQYNRAAGVILQMHYGIIGCLGLDGMKALIEPLKRPSALKAAKAYEVRKWDETTRRDLAKRSGGTGVAERQVPDYYVRAVQDAGSAVDTTKQTAQFSFSSEAPVERWDWWYGRYYEILGHSPGEFDLTRLNNNGAFLWNHLRDDQRGCVERAWVMENRAYCEVRFSSNPPGQELMRDMADGIKRNVSFAYDPKVSVLVMTDERDCETYRVIDWEAFEVSSVSIPADQTVGLDRSQSQSQSVFIREQPKQEVDVPETLKREDVIAEERQRCTELTDLGKMMDMPDLAQKAINEGWTLDQAKSHFFDAKKARLKAEGDIRPVSNNILSARDLKKYSLLRAIEAGIINNNWAKAGFEKEVSDEIGRQCGKDSVNGLYVPIRELTVQTRRRIDSRAAQNVGNFSQGGALVDTDLMIERMVDYLYNRTMVAQLGATYLTGLSDLVDIPRETGPLTAYWISAEGDTATESNIPFETFGLRPRDLFGLVQVTRRMMQQVDATENLVRTRLLRTLNTEIDRVCLHGTGTSGEPRGIANTPNINSVPIGTNGGPLTWAHILQHEELISSYNADVSSMAYLGNSAIRGLLKRTLMNPAGTDAQWIWQNVPGDFGSGMVNGYRAAVSNNVRRDNTKGTGTGLSSLFFGDWENVFIGEWGVMEILPNPFGAAFRSGGMEFLAKVTTDVAIARPEAFSYTSDIDTSA